ncbi:hypothetical protein ACOSP7_022931 [Xanthoceras sorbifolium]
MVEKFSTLQFFFLLFLSLSLLLHAEDFSDDQGFGCVVITREERKSLAETEFGEISAVNVSDGLKGRYYLQLITLEPSSLFLPVLLHAGMVFYVSSGSGKLSWTDEGDIKRVQLKRGDIYRLQPGTVFFVESNLELIEREKLRIYAMFSNTDEEAFEPSIGPYTSMSDLVLGFDKKVLAAAFKVPEDVIEAITTTTKPPAMVHALPKEKTNIWQLEDRFLKAFIVGRGGGPLLAEENDKKKTFNIFDAKPDFKNCNGWSITVNKKELKLLKRSNIGVFMVNLTKGSMMGPHWNPMASEIAIVLHGQGMVRVVCPSTADQSDCKDMRFRVEEGDVFVVPRFHPMAQMSFNNDSFVFMGFSTATHRNHPQFLAGKNSVLHALNKQILALSFNVTKVTIDELLTPQRESVILDCTSCAEEEERAMEEQIQKEKEEQKKKEEKKKEEEEAKKREEEEKKKEEEEEAARKREEEEEKKREEEEEKKREEEEARKREEEEEKKREEEEAARKREEKEEKKREEEEARKREEEEARKREEEAARKREEEEEKKREEGKARKREEEAARKREEEKREQEEAKRREEEAEAEQEEARRQEEEREHGGGGGGGGGDREEEAARKREGKKKEQEEAKRREEAAETEQEEARRQEEERKRRGGGG